MLSRSSLTYFYNSLYYAITVDDIFAWQRLSLLYPYVHLVTWAKKKFFSRYMFKLSLSV